MFVQTFPGKFTQQKVETSKKKKKNIFLFVHLGLQGGNDGKDSSLPLKKPTALKTTEKKGKVQMTLVHLSNNST